MQSAPSSNGASRNQRCPGADSVDHDEWCVLAESRCIFTAPCHHVCAGGKFATSWAALRNGSWECNELLENWHVFVASENNKRVCRHEGYEAVSVDMTGFWRPRLKGWLGKHYHSLAQRSLPAVVFGVVVLSGQVRTNGRRCCNASCVASRKLTAVRMQLLQETKNIRYPIKSQSTMPEFGWLTYNVLR